MKLIQLIKSEIIKNNSIKRWILIVLILTISCIGLVEFQALSYRTTQTEVEPFLQNYQNRYQELLNKPNHTLEEDYLFTLYSAYFQLFDYLHQKGDHYNNWKTVIGYDAIDLFLENKVIQLFLEQPENNDLQQICQNDGTGSFSPFQSKVSSFCHDYTKESLEETFLGNQKKLETYQTLLEKDEYYLYLQYLKEQNLVPSYAKKIVDVLIENKLKDSSSYLIQNCSQYANLYFRFDSANQEDIPFICGDTYPSNSIDDYQEHIQYYRKLKEESRRNREIILYSTIHHIPHDLLFDSDFAISSQDVYFTSKTAVNQVLHLSIIVMLLVAITSGGIVSNEHSRGTIKNILTTPIRRWKFLLSKFLYLILHTYFIWFLGLAIISIYTGIRYGFTDLMTPKLIFQGGHVVEVNYYLYLLQQILIASIPVICFLSILFFFSSITLNTQVTVGITTILSILSPILWFCCYNFHFYLPIHTPFLYFDCGMIFLKSNFYLETSKFVPVSLSCGIGICIVTTILLYLITNMIYIKKDVKN